MCGFVGVFGNDVNKAREKLRPALKTIAYRGPDATGFYEDNALLLGHNRLKIIDLSDEANQPFENKDYLLAVNGEIYNYIELKEQCKFSTKTSSDTEVLFKVLEKHNDKIEEGIHLLNGMFAFSFYDKQRKRLVLCRDRLGVKPLYYAMKDDNTVIFASEIKAILKFGLKFDINHNAVMNFLVNRTLAYEDRTFFDGIHSVRPGSYVVFSYNGHNLKREEKKYWDFPSRVEENIPQDAVKKFRELFFDAVTIRLRADVPTATLLSGGLDSSAVTASIASLFPDRKAVSISAVYEGDPMCEKDYAMEVVNKYKNIEAIWLNITRDMADNILDEVIYHQETPIADGSMVSHFLLMRALKKYGIKVILSGQCGDEILGGYIPAFLRAHYADCLKKGHIGALNVHSLFYALPNTLKNNYKRCMMFRNYSRYFSIKSFKQVDDYHHQWGNQTILNSYLIDCLNYLSLPGFLHYEDRNTMAYSIEGRGPFLDYRLVEFMLSLPNEFKIQNGLGKAILRESMKDILPEKIAKRTDKQGFYAPINKWIQEMDNAFMEDDVFKEKFNYIKFDNAVDANIDFSWRLQTLYKWYKMFVK